MKMNKVISKFNKLYLIKNYKNFLYLCLLNLTYKIVLVKLCVNNPNKQNKLKIRKIIGYFKYKYFDILKYKI